MRNLTSLDRYIAKANTLAMLASMQVSQEINLFCVMVSVILSSNVKLRASRENHFISTINRLKLYARDGFSCFYCGMKSDLTLDHIIPQHTGINHNWDNLITACRRCNSSKKHQCVDAWLRKQQIAGKTCKTAKQVKEQANKPVQ